MSEDHRSAEFAAPRKQSDLGVRTLSAIIMAAVAGLAVWLGSFAWKAFVVLVATGVLWEWVKLSCAIASSLAARAAWFVAGLIYVGIAAEVLWPADRSDFVIILIIVLCVVATDIGAYFSGRSFGGPKIAPRISPSKTWSGLVGGALAAGLVFWAAVAWLETWLGRSVSLHEGASVLGFVATGAIIAIIAQTGDFFESWMKRRAGVKDSGQLIPGHGGLFDRVDGLLAVLFVAGIAARMARFP